MLEYSHKLQFDNILSYMTICHIFQYDKIYQYILIRDWVSISYLCHSRAKPSTEHPMLNATQSDDMPRQIIWPMLQPQRQTPKPNR